MQKQHRDFLEVLWIKGGYQWHLLRSFHVVQHHLSFAFGKETKSFSTKNLDFRCSLFLKASIDSFQVQRHILGTLILVHNRHEYMWLHNKISLHYILVAFHQLIFSVGLTFKVIINTSIFALS